MSEENIHTLIIPQEHAGYRLDKSLATLLPQYSRSKIQTWINMQQVRVNGSFQSGRYCLSGGEQVVLAVSQEEQNILHLPEDIPINIVYEDEHLIVLNKPAGLVVHPGAGNQHGTLMNALLFYNSEQSKLPRAGIMHRLDKDTSGIMVVAKTLVAHTSLTNLLQDRHVERRYYAIVRGQLISGGTIDSPIGRHPHERTKMAVNERGKTACTHYKIIEKFKRHTWVEAKLDTGRTHQIRVHFSSINYPIVGDTVYAPRIQRVANVPEELNKCLSQFPRQALHAFKLSFQHPVSSESMSWRVDMPEDMQTLLKKLRQYSSI